MIVLAVALVACCTLAEAVFLRVQLALLQAPQPATTPSQQVQVAAPAW